MPIFRRKNCIHTASGIFAVCKRLHSTLVESGLSQPVYCADVYRDNSVTNILLMNKENCALKLVDEITLYTCVCVRHSDSEVVLQSTEVTLHFVTGIWGIFLLHLPSCSDSALCLHFDLKR